MGSGWTKNGFVYLLIIAAAAALFFSLFPRQEQTQAADLSQVAQWIRAGEARSVTVDGETLTVELKNGDTFTAHKDEATPFQETMTRLGIPPEQTGKIFDEFVQLGNSARDRRQGLGLGLAIVRRLAESLGSTVAVRSRLGRGSVFEVSVPLSADRPASPTPEPLDGDTAALQGLLVLVVDDELDILIGMEALLVSWGCFVIVARSVAEAERRASAR